MGGVYVKTKVSGGITSDTNGLSQTYLITDAINGIERISTVGSEKDKIQIKLKTNSALVVDTSGLAINYDSTNFRLGTGQTDNDKLKIRVRHSLEY